MSFFWGALGVQTLGFRVQSYSFGIRNMKLFFFGGGGGGALKQFCQTSPYGPCAKIAKA